MVSCVPSQSNCRIHGLIFSVKWRGVRMSWDQLAQVWCQSQESFRQHELSLGPLDVPSLTDLESAFRRVKKGKAMGMDEVPPEICKACPALLAKQCYSTLLMMVIHGQESLQHKGGFLTPAYKGKGSPLLPSSCRSLLVSSHMGKVLHRAVRQHQATLYEQYLSRQQLGGRRCVPVTLGLHEARSFLRGGQRRGCSVALW